MSNPLISARDRFAESHPEQLFLHDGREWGWIEAGDGPALILIPGTLGRADIFWQQIGALSDRLRIVAVSYPASGRIEDWADDLVALMDRLGIESAAVLGSSLGGYLAQYLAGHAPGRVDKLIAANTLHSVHGLDQRMPYALDLDSAAIDELRAGFGTGLKTWAEAHPDQADLVGLLLEEVEGRIPPPELRARLKALKSGPDLPPVTLEADRITSIEADDDPLIPPAMRAAVRARLAPGVAYRFLSGGHFPYVARPAAYTALLEQVMDLPATTEESWGDGAERTL